MNKTDINKFIEALRALDFYSDLRTQGYMTSGQVCEACEAIEKKIEDLMKEYVK